MYENLKEDKILISLAEDRYDMCVDGYMLSYTDFLDLRQQSLLMERFKGAACMEFYGGHDDAERKICVFRPDYLEGSIGEYFKAEEEDNPVVWLRITRPEKGRELTHRDYLGSITGMGIKREKIGDILVREDGADVACLKEVAEYLLYNYEKAGRVNVKTELVSAADISLPRQRFKEIRDTVASLRIDSVVSSAFGMSRAKAQEAITRGIVFADSRQILKPDFTVKEGMKLVVRGMGKARLAKVGGNSRKGRTYIVIEKYL